MLYAWNLCVVSWDRAIRTDHIPIHVFLWADRLRDGAFARCTDMGTEGELDQDTADGGVIVKLLDHINNFLHGGFLGEGDVLELDADLLCGLCLHADIDNRVGACTSLNNDKLGLETGGLCLQTPNALSDL